MAWVWPKLSQLLTTAHFSLSAALVKNPHLGLKGCRDLGSQSVSQGGLYFPFKAGSNPPALCRAGLLANISHTASSAGWPHVLLSWPGGEDRPEEAIWLENEKRAKQLANLASEKEIWRENRKAITSESQVSPYSKLVELLGKKNKNTTDKPFCSSADASATGALLPVKQQFPMDVLHEVSDPESVAQWLFCPSVRQPYRYL